jgi:cytochrome b
MHGVATNVMLGVILLHLIGVAMSSILHRENLVRAMFTGFKRVPGKQPSGPEESIQRSYNWLGVLMVAVVIVFWFAYVKRPLG